MQLNLSRKDSVVVGTECHANLQDGHLTKSWESLGENGVPVINWKSYKDKQEVGEGSQKKRSSEGPEKVKYQSLVLTVCYNQLLIIWVELNSFMTDSTHTLVCCTRKLRALAFTLLFILPWILCVCACMCELWPSLHLLEHQFSHL